MLFKLISEIVSLIINACLCFRRKKNSNSGNDDVLPNHNNNDNTVHNDVLPDDVHDDGIVPCTVVPLGNTEREATPMCTSLQPQITDDSAVAEELDNSA
ncbi:hypothetical protein DPMN_150273 [Dreissena polymorpha]|uniref:Uncharacterized protein n=1 Tax=Dreissena polymorpha TaxID=45954 RepID=A0A9D4FD23_DREPO|nr:hypothetical protein DPMN_150273 [Dreissena polymorpha]